MTRKKLKRAEIIDLGSSSFGKKRAIDVRSFVERRAFKHRKINSTSKFQQSQKNQEKCKIETILQSNLDTSVDEFLSEKKLKTTYEHDPERIRINKTLELQLDDSHEKYALYTEEKSNPERALEFDAEPVERQPRRLCVSRGKIFGRYYSESR